MGLFGWRVRFSIRRAVKRALVERGKLEKKLVEEVKLKEESKN